MATLIIDGKSFEVDDGQNLLNACLSLGFDIPYFCWHPAMGSVGACRQCAVKQFKDEKDPQGRIVMSCMTPVEDGMRISIDDPEVRAFRASVIEWLMANHPHDCPVCDEGGECHLQDMTVMTGHNYRQYRFKKRTHRNQDLGPFLQHEMNRCIQCYRCFRFYRHYAGGRDFNVFGCHDHVYFGRHRDGVLENPFSGNLVEICPTGVFTDKSLKKHYTRKWDLQTAPSVCVHCGLGCNTLAGERYGLLRRIRNRYHPRVNGYFLCDRGRYGYEFVNSDRRVRQPLQRVERQGRPVPVDGQAAQAAALAIIRRSRGLIGIGSPRAALEANFMLRELVGPEHFYAGVPDSEHEGIQTVIHALRHGQVRMPSLQETGDADVVFVLGEDVANTAPLLSLSLRQLVHRKACRTARRVRIPDWNDNAIREVVQHEKEMLYVATVNDTFLDDVAMRTFRGSPDRLACLGFAVAAALDPAAPAPAGTDAALRAPAEAIAAALKQAQRPLIVSGTGCGSRRVIEAAANAAYAAGSAEQPAGLVYALPECNTLGLGLMQTAGGLEAAFKALADGAADTVIVLENDLYRRADAASVDRFLEAARQVLVLDHLQNRTVAKADLVLPAATFAEGTGTLVNTEGRAQRFFKVFPPPPPVAESWRWLRDLMVAAGRREAGAWQTVDDIVAEMAGSLPVFAALPEAAPQASLRMPGGKVPRQSHRYSGRTAMQAHRSVHEPKPPEDPDSALAFSMEGHDGPPPAALISRFWQPGWNSVQALNKFQSEICGPLKGGEPGRRLLEPTGTPAADYFAAAPVQAPLPENRWHLAALHHVFGSEELSPLSPGIAERTPAPYLALNPQDATELGIEGGDRVIVKREPDEFNLPVRLMPGLPRKVAGLPVGLPEGPVIALPAVVALEKRDTHA